MKTYGKLQVFFEEPFWVGIFERMEEDKLSVCKVTFGAEPKDYEVLDYVLTHYYELKFSPAIEIEKATKSLDKVNPKRLQREAKKEVLNAGIGTKSQQALKLMHESSVEMRKANKKARKEEEQLLRFEQRQEKRKEKHKGH